MSEKLGWERGRPFSGKQNDGPIVAVDAESTAYVDGAILGSGCSFATGRHQPLEGRHGTALEKGRNSRGKGE